MAELFSLFATLRVNEWIMLVVIVASVIGFAFILKEEREKEEPRIFEAGMAYSFLSFVSIYLISLLVNFLF